MGESRFGPYVVHELLGTGGMATVHRAESQSAGGFRKRVALKRMLPHLADEPHLIESFAREARLASHLHHQHIAQTFDLGVMEGTYFIAMELIVGPTLRQLMHQCETAAGAIPIEHVLALAVPIAEALDYAHTLHDENGRSLGIVHRDVSPTNVIVSSAGIVKLIDFGLAKVASSRSTKTGILKGKLSYMAPEYTLGQLDHRADLFSLGVVVHEMLTGRPLFDAPSDYDAVQLLRAMPIQPPSRWNARVSRDLDDIVMTALARDPAKRWQTAAAMSAALRGVAREQGSVTTHEQLAAWIEWAFTQTAAEESKLARVIADLGDASDPRRKLPSTGLKVALTPAPTPVTTPRDRSPLTELTPTPKLERREPPVAPRAETDVATTPLPIARERAGLGRRLGRALLILLLVAAGAAATAYFASDYFDFGSKSLGI